ncbi:MAG TPA: ABC transporter substrate-binding protein [Pyrinomonadaceae bacterium]|nr:ABC transporter substrate-binding protein [Pyrinomonadaceae bacterium]
MLLQQSCKWIVLLLAIICLACSVLLVSFAQPERTYTIAFTVREMPSPFATPAHGGPHWVVTTYLFDTLVWKDQSGVVPLLAESWESAAGGKDWTFNLRRGVHWHDGQMLSADDVKFTFDYLREHPFPMFASEAASQIEHVEVHSPGQVKFHLKQPAQDFLDDIAGIILILPRHIWQSVIDPLKFLSPSAFVGTGPFKYVETRRGEYHLFQANEHYFLGRPQIDRLVLKAVSNPPLALESGDVDAASFNTPLAVARFRNRADFRIVTGPYSYYLSKLIFNVSRPPFNSKVVRQAFAYSLDRQEIVNKVLGGAGIVSSAGLLHPDSDWFNPDLPKYERNKILAEELLKQGGFTHKGADGVREAPGSGHRLSFTLYARIDNSPEMARTAEMIRDQLAEVGVHLDLKPVNTGPLESILASGNFDIALDGHGGTLRPEFVADSADFPAHIYDNDELKTCRDQFLHSSDGQKRREAAWKIQSIIAEDLPGLGIYNPNSPVVYRKSKGIEWFWTRQGLGGGAPIWWNKLALLKFNSALAQPSSAAGRPTFMLPAIILSCGAIVALFLGYRKLGKR